MITLVTGLDETGFVGPHLARLLREKNQHPVPLALEGKNIDLRDAEMVNRFIMKNKPQRVYHLAAQSSVARSWQEPELTYAVNYQGTYNLLTALKKHAAEARVLFVSTGTVYGSAEKRKEYLRTLPPEKQAEFPADPLRFYREDDPPCPANPYSQSKREAENLCLRAVEKKQLDVRIVRPLGHTGPGQRLGFVVPDMASQVAALAVSDFPPVIRAGKLDVGREFSDVRDVVRAYFLIMEEGEPGNIYNLASNQMHTVEEVITTLLKLAGVNARIVQEEKRMRPGKDESSLRLDVQKIQDLGFRFQIPFTQTLNDILQEWILRIKAGTALQGTSDNSPFPNLPH